MDMCCEKNTIIVWSMKWWVTAQEEDEREPGERLCKKTVKHVN